MTGSYWSLTIGLGMLATAQTATDQLARPPEAPLCGRSTQQQPQQPRQEESKAA